MEIGINIGSISDYATDAPYADVFKQFRSPWGVLDKPWLDASAHVDAAGWPLAGQSVSVLCEMFGYPAGDYAVSWVGPSSGVRVSLVGGGDVPVRNLLPTGTGGFMGMVSIDPPAMRAGGQSLCVSLLSTSAPVINVSLRMPFTYADDLFNPDFVRQLRQFSCLRTMDAQGMNSQPPVVTWASRPKVSDPFWGAGIPFELTVSLANEVGRDLWACVPDTASDDWLSGAAAYAAANLAPDLKMYVEFSNEVWNFSFPQAGRVRDSSPSNPNLTTPAAQDLYARMGENIAYQGKRCGDAFRAAFAKFGRSDDVRPVLCGQAANPDWVAGGLAYLKAKFGSVSPFYGIGVAPYMDLYDDAARDSLTSLDGLFDTLGKSNLKNAFAWIGDNAKVATQYGLKMLSYECGQGLMPDTRDPYATLAKAAQDDPRMMDAYLAFASAWTKAGGGLACHYDFVGPKSQWGCWGLREYLDSPPSVKSKAIVLLIASSPMPTPTVTPTPTPTPTPTTTTTPTMTTPTVTVTVTATVTTTVTVQATATPTVTPTPTPPTSTTTATAAPTTTSTTSTGTVKVPGHATTGHNASTGGGKKK